MTDSREIHLDQEFHCEYNQEDDIIDKKELLPRSIVQSGRVEQSKCESGVADDHNNCSVEQGALSNTVHHSPET